MKKRIRVVRRYILVCLGVEEGEWSDKDGVMAKLVAVW